MTFDMRDRVNELSEPIVCEGSPMTKSVVIKFSLMPEADNLEVEAIRARIASISLSSIPFCNKIVEFRIEESEENMAEKLSEMGLPANAARNVMMIYGSSTLK